MRRAAYLASLGVIFTVPWENVITFAGFGTIARSVGMLAAGLWLLVQLTEAGMRRPDRFHIAMFGFVVWSGFTFLWSVDSDETIVRFFTLVQLMVFALIVWDLYRTTAAIRNGLQAYVLGAFVSALAIFANYFTSNVSGYEGRVTAGAFKFDHAGLILALGIPIAWYLSRSPQSMQGRDLFRIANYAYIPAGAIALALTGTRTALVALIPAAFFIVWSVTGLRTSRRVGAAIFLVAAAFVVASVVPEESVQRLGTTAEEIRSGQFSARAEIWSQGVEAFLHRPLEGVGAGAFQAAVAREQVAHNTLLSVATETGVIGLVLFGYAIAHVVRSVSQHPRYERRFWLALLWGAAIGASSLTWEHKKITWLVLSLLLASAATQSGERSRRYVRKPSARRGARGIGGPEARSAHDHVPESKSPIS